MTQADGSYWVYDYDERGQVIAGNRYWANGSPVLGQSFEYDHDDIGNRKSTSGRGSSQSIYTVNLANQYDERTVTDVVDIQGIANPDATVKVGGVTLGVGNRQGEYFHREHTMDNSIGLVSQGVNVEATFQGSTEIEGFGNQVIPKTPEESDYDSYGRLIQDGRWTYHWEGKRLVSMTARFPTTDPGPDLIEFEYDDRGRRVGKYISGGPGAHQVNYFYDGWNIVGEVMTWSGQALEFGARTLYVWGPDLSGTLLGVSRPV